MRGMKRFSSVLLRAFGPSPPYLTSQARVITTVLAYGASHTGAIPLQLL